ncbi:MAG: ComEC/Rec2 family competence protein, partial [Anaerolineaceae bacterium]
VLAAFFSGGLRYQLAQPSFSAADLASYNDGAGLRLVGLVDAPPDVRDRSQILTVKAETLWRSEEAEPLPVKGTVRLQLDNPGTFAVGDRLEIRGKLITPPENAEFSYRDYLARQGVYSLMLKPAVQVLAHGQGSPLKLILFRVQTRALELIQRFYPEPEASLLSGILLGVDSGIPPDLEKAYQDTGTAHIIAISGFNMAIIAGLIMKLCAKLLPGLRSLPLAFGIIALYTLLVGGSPAVVRAAVMSRLAMVGTQLGRRQSGANVLVFSAAAMCLFNPNLPWDVSFQLSFAATLGLVLYADRFQRAFENLAGRFLNSETLQKISAPVSEYFLFTLAAQLTTLPVTLYHFQRLSLSSLLANPLILPPQPALMILSGLSVLVGWILPPLGQAIAWLAEPLAAYSNRMVLLLAGIPGSAFDLTTVSPLFVFGFYAVLAVFTWGKGWLKPLTPLLKPATLIGGLALVTCLVWRVGLSQPDGRLHLARLSDSDPPVYFIQAPQGSTLLINANASPSTMRSAIDAHLAPDQHALDALLISADHTPTLQALDQLLERYTFGQVIWCPRVPEGEAARQLAERLTQRGIPQTVLQPGGRIGLEPGIELQLIAGAGAACGLELAVNGQVLELTAAQSLPDSGTDFVIYPPDEVDSGVLSSLQSGWRNAVRIFSGAALFGSLR